HRHRYGHDAERAMTATPAARGPPSTDARSPPTEDGAQQRQGARLVEGLVAVAALGRLHAARAPPRARAALDHGASGLEMAVAGCAAEFGDPHAAREAVVDHDRGPAVVVLVRR